MAMTRILSNCFYTLHRNIKKINTDPHRQFIRNESTSKRSGLQKQVLGLYRKLLRTSHSKRQSSQTFPESLADPASTVFAVKKKFRGKADSVSRRDVDRIEYYIRQGEKYVKTLDMYGVKGMHTVWGPGTTSTVLEVFPSEERWERTVQIQSRRILRTLYREKLITGVTLGRLNFDWRLFSCRENLQW